MAAPTPIAQRIPARSASSVISSEAKGITPTKLSMASAEIRPRKASGARSCTVVFASPKVIDVPVASVITAGAACQNERASPSPQSEKTTSTAATASQPSRRSRATLSIRPSPAASRSPKPPSAAR